ncbi:MAG: ABC transporter substrate-binding protein [Ekhidna sp.]
MLVLPACGGQSESKEALVNSHGLAYAKGFHLESDHEGNHLVVSEPWPQAPRPIRYQLKNVPKTIVCTSTSHLPFIELLGAEEKVVGFPNVNYISSKTYIERYENGLLTDLGPDGNINLELLLGLNPDAVIAFDMGGESIALDKIKEAGIPVYYNSDFLEQSPLGRAEWIKFFGALLDKQSLADSIFSEIEKEYLRLSKLTSNIPTRPSILSGVVYGDTWFLPGGNNWSAAFFKNAGGQYLWESDSTSGWLELSFESVYEKANDADFWIGTSTINSKNELLGQDNRYEGFRAFAEDEVYNYNKIIGPNGGYDFFESGYTRPDLVLADLISILHPELLPEYETTYFQKLP